MKFKNFETLFLHDVKFSGWKDEGVKEEVTPFWKEEDCDRVVEAGLDLHSEISLLYSGPWRRQVASVILVDEDNFLIF